jgi:hypothetical protein
VNNLVANHRKADSGVLSDEEFYRREFIERPIVINCPENGVNPWLPSISRQLWNKGYSDQEIFNLLYQATRKVKHRTITQSEIRRATAFVIGTPEGSLHINNNGHKEKPKEKPTFDPALLSERAAKIPELVDAAYFEARSQFTCYNRTPAGFLHTLYLPGEHVWITTNPESSKGEIWTHDGPQQRFDELDHYRTGCQGVWYLTYPISAQLYSIERCKSAFNPDGLSFTTLESATAWRYLLIETDVAPQELWRKIIVQLPQKIVAIYESGKNGDHVLIRLDAASKADFDVRCAQFDDDLVRLGACQGSLTARRLSRLPNCMREETGQLQRLLYLAPDADGTPIAQLPLRTIATSDPPFDHSDNSLTPCSVL